MGHSVFGWSYPPGCSGPPEGPEMSKESEEVGEMLSSIEIPQSTLNRIGALLAEFSVPEEAAEAILFLLSGPMVEEAVSEKITTMIDDLALRASNCPRCSARQIEAEEKAEKEAQAYWEEMKDAPLPESDTCPHGEKSHECNACLVAGDLAYDAARERGRR